ncbi:MAG: hypothetical protein AAGI12_10900 [Pseudomonadota bacterium]
MALTSARAALPTAAAVPNQARFWAIYISALHGECTPKTLQNLLHIPEVDAKRYIGQLVADGVIQPSALLQNSVSKILKNNETGLVENAPERPELKASSPSGDPPLGPVDEDVTDATMDEDLGESFRQGPAKVETGMEKGTETDVADDAELDVSAATETDAGSCSH